MDVLKSPSEFSIILKILFLRKWIFSHSLVKFSIRSHDSPLILDFGCGWKYILVECKRTQSKHGSTLSGVKGCSHSEERTNYLCHWSFNNDHFMLLQRPLVIRYISRLRSIDYEISYCQGSNASTVGYGNLEGLSWITGFIYCGKFQRFFHENLNFHYQVFFFSHREYFQLH